MGLPRTVIFLPLPVENWGMLTSLEKFTTHHPSAQKMTKNVFTTSIKGVFNRCVSANVSKNSFAKHCQHPPIFHRPCSATAVGLRVPPRSVPTAIRPGTATKSARRLTGSWFTRKSVASQAWQIPLPASLIWQIFKGLSMTDTIAKKVVAGVARNFEVSVYNRVHRCC